MRFSYTYKTSDGIRHEDRIEAPSREEAFSLLRQKGIRAIKVVSLSGSKANGEEKIITRKRFVVAALVLGLLAGVGTVLCLQRVDLRDGRVRDLERESLRILTSFDASLLDIRIAEVHDFSKVAEPSNRTDLLRKIARGYEGLNAARTEARDVFRSAYDRIPAEEPALRDEAQRIFLDLMDSLDVREARIANGEKAFRLLDSNRGKWKCSGDGKSTVLDSAFADELGLILRDLSLKTFL